MSHSKKKLLRSATVASVAVIGFHCYPAYAQVANNESADSEPQALQDIVVTAQRRKESLQDVPLSITALTEKSLERTGAHSLRDYFRQIPGMNYAPLATGERGGPNIVIRGVSNTRLGGVDASAQSGTTSFYINEIPVTVIDPVLFDVERVEVLKGPQGTLFGAASMGGTIKVVMNRAEANELYGRAKFTGNTTAGGGEGFAVESMINIPLVQDVLGARLVAYYRREAGYIDVIEPPLTDTSTSLVPSPSGFPVLGAQAGNIRKDTNERTSKGARLSFLFTPNDRLTIEPVVTYQKMDRADGDTFDASLAAGYVKKRFIREPLGEEFFLASLEASYDFGPVRLVSATGYFHRNYDEAVDVSLGTFRVFGGTAAGGIAAIGGLGTSINTRTFTQEVRLQSTGNSGSDFLDRFDWVIGAFYTNEERDGSQLWTNPGFNANADPSRRLARTDDLIFASTWNARDKNKSAFADVAVTLLEGLKLSAGVRYFEQSQVVNRQLVGPLQGAAFTTTPQLTLVSASETGWTPRYTASYNITKDIMIYGSAAKGFRAGGGVVPVTEPNCSLIIEQQNLQDFTNGFTSDNLWNYEVGAKTSWMNGRLVLNGSAFRIKWSNLQQQISLAQFSNSTCTRALTANVGEAEIEGFEAVASLKPVPNLLLQANISQTKARLSRPDPRSNFGRAGDRLQNVPDWTYGASAELAIPNLVVGDGFIRADFTHVGDITTVVGVPSNPLRKLSSYSNVNFRAGVNWKGTALEIFADNVFNTVQVLSAGTQSSVPQTILHTTNRPRTIGLSIGRRF